MYLLSLYILLAAVPLASMGSVFKWDRRGCRKQPKTIPWLKSKNKQIKTIPKPLSSFSKKENSVRSKVFEILNFRQKKSYYFINMTNCYALFSKSRGRSRKQPKTILILRYENRMALNNHRTYLEVPQRENSIRLVIMLILSFRQKTSLLYIIILSYSWLAT